MIEPDAWEPTDLERKLLDAAKSDRVPAELGVRMASALSASKLAPAASASTQGAFLFSNTALWGALSIAVLSATAALYTATSSPHVEAFSRPVPSIEYPPPARAPAVAELAPAPVAAPAPAASPTTAPAKPNLTQALREEIALLDRARSALEHDAPQRAATLLDQHRRRFPTGTLRPEADALRIEALRRLGNTARADRLAQRFLAAYPAHPLSERVSNAAPARDQP